MEWHLKRSPEKSRAIVYSDDSHDSLSSLGIRVGHDIVGAFGPKGWLKKENGDDIANYSEYKYLRQTQCKFSVPNKFLLVIGGNIFFLAKKILQIKKVCYIIIYARMCKV